MLQAPIAIAKAQPSRRQFLQLGAAAGAGLIIGLQLPLRAAKGVTPADGFAPNAFVRIQADDSVTILAKLIEFGQGSYTGLATILAEELDADWSQVRAEAAPANAEIYNNLH